ncbi:MAG: STAS domain-containing protein [Blastocatellia bacterium]
MLRIMEESAANNLIILRLDGRLVSDWVEVLRSSCEQAFQNESRLNLDLAGVSFADQDGLQLLRQLERQQVELINRSPFLQELMKDQMELVASDFSSD